MAWESQIYLMVSVFLRFLTKDHPSVSSIAVGSIAHPVRQGNAEIPLRFVRSFPSKLWNNVAELGGLVNSKASQILPIQGLII